MMRQITVLIRPTEGYFNPIDERLLEHPDVDPKAVHHVELLADETLTMLARVTGDIDAYREILRESDDVIEFAVTSDGTDGIGYSHIIPSEFTLSLFEKQRSSKYVVRMPVEYTTDGRQRYTIVGRADVFADRGLTTPDNVEITIESVSSYQPNINSRSAVLTTREQEVLTTAIGRGYYQNPRQTTHANLATELDISASAIGKHLRNVEAKVFSSDFV